jgi:hypothetical protein
LDYKSIIELVAVIVAAITAGFAYFTIRKNMQTNRGTAMLACLEKHFYIMEHKTKALADKSESMAKQYYRENFDLLWSEIHLWKDGVISDVTMFDWLHLRQIEYDEDKINVDGIKEPITYKKQWGRYIEEGYFREGDQYIELIKKNHCKRIKNIMDLKIEKGRLNNSLLFRIKKAFGQVS